MYAIEAEGLRKTYAGGVDAVKGIDFEVSEGEVVAILNAGGYPQAMSSTHCLRPMASAVYLEREERA